MSGYRESLIREAREHAEHYRRYDDTDALVNTLVEVANMLAADAEVRASVVTEEPEGRRVFAAAYRAGNGNVIPIGGETTVREHAQKTVDDFTREDDEGRFYFVASRIVPPWVPVEQEGTET